MHQAFDRRRQSPHTWIILSAILALTALYPIETLTARQTSAPATEPTFSLPGGYYDRDVQLNIYFPRPDTSVIFTLDGRAPTHAAGTIYTQPIHLSSAAPAVTVVRARGVLPGGELGPVLNASYFVGVQAALPLLSLIIDPDDLWDPERGIYAPANSHERGMTWERPADVTYVDRDRHSGFHVPAGARLHGGASRDFDKKSLRLYFRREYGAGRLEYPLFAGSDAHSFDRLVLHNGGQDWHSFPHPNYTNWTLVRNQLADRLALELGGYATHSRPVLLFINGEPWGIYYIRERIDSRFLADRYGVTAADFLDSPEHVGERATIAGDRENWDHLLRFVGTHDLADPDNYAYVHSQVDVANFIDYTILQIYAANFDWPHHNVQQFRPRVQGGRWQWMF
ncbi:MAG: CotH kinase family protein, partial [Chloroflexota bacterium]|nr:CotH kinase family protein [Chloroflexota bacterium]